MDEQISNQVMEIDLMAIAKAIWRRAWLVALSMVVGACILFAYAFLFITPIYESTASFYVNNSSFSVGSSSFSISTSELSAAQKLVDTYLVILNTRSTLEEVIDAAQLDYDYVTLGRMLDAQSINGTEIFSITVSNADPRKAELIANTIADVLPGKISNIVEGSSVRIVDYAVVSDEKVSPSLKKYAVIGAILGLLICCAAIIIMELLDDKVKNEDFLLQNFDIPLLTVVPDIDKEMEADEYYNRHGSNDSSGSERPAARRK